MPRKLTVVGVLAALVLGVVGLTQSASATPVQSFCSASASTSAFPAGHGGCAGGLLAVHSDFCFDTTNGTGVGPTAPSMPVGPILAGNIACGPNTSDSQIPAGIGVPIKSWQVLMIPQGARQTLPAYYLPAAWTYGAAAPGTVTGNVSANTDLLCNGGADILSPTQRGDFDVNQYPGNGWGTGFNFVRQNVGSATPLGGPPDVTTGSINGYVDSIKPMPASFTDVTLDRSNLLLLWLGGVTPIVLPPTGTALGANDGTPLQNLVTLSPYTAGMHVSVALLAGDPNPPTQDFLCLDSPQNSVAENTLIIPPSLAGSYVRWTVLQSAADTIDGTVSRILDVQCIGVGVAPACDMSDADNDLVPAAVEAINGTTATVGGNDSDADGASDYDELFQFTNPLVADTDGDGSLDKQDDLAGFNCASAGGACTVVNLGDTLADDNCPVDANPAQDNTDSQPDFTNSPNTPAGAIYRGDATNPHQDHEGDACDADIDNDGLNNVVEAGFRHPTTPPACARDIPNTTCVTNPGTPALSTLYCLSLAETKDASGIQLLTAVGGSTIVSTSPTNPDSDSDGGLDGRECLFGSDPTSAALASCQPACGSPSPNDRFPVSVGDTDGDLLSGTILGGGSFAEVFFRTAHINLPGGGTLNDLEQVGSYRPPSPALACTDPNAAVVCDNKVGNADNDSDGDLLNDGVEVKWYGTSPANFDTDGDGCSDGREAADVNGDHVVNVVDLQAIAAHSNGTLVPGGPATLARPLGSALQVGGPYNSAGVRRDEVATYDVNKDGAISVLDLQLTAKLSGAPDSGKCQSLALTALQAQTAKAIVNAANP